MISRQAANATVWEFVGKRCDALVAITSSTQPRAASYCFIQVDGAWFRFTIDASVLFLDETSTPGDDEDLDPNDVQVSLLEAGSPVRRIMSFNFSEGVAVILLEDGFRIQFTENRDGQMDIVNN